MFVRRKCKTLREQSFTAVDIEDDVQVRPLILSMKQTVTLDCTLRVNHLPPENNSPPLATYIWIENGQFIAGVHGQFYTVRMNYTATRISCVKHLDFHNYTRSLGTHVLLGTDRLYLLIVLNLPQQFPCIYM